MSKEDSREPAPTTTSAAPPAPPAAPAKPAAPKPAATAPAKAVPRRSFLSWVTLAWVAFTASMLASLTATARFMFPNVLFEPPPTFKAGYPNEIQVGQVDERFKQRFAVWLVRTAYDEWGMAPGIYALSTVCTHRGCTPNWL